MSGRKVLFFASLIFSLTGFSMEDNCKAGTRLGHTSCDQAIGMPNPAAVFCVQNGGTLEERSTANGVDSVCRFKDGSECGQWPFERRECGPGECAVWSLDSNSCQTLMVTVGATDGCQNNNNGACATDCSNDSNCNTALDCDTGCANVTQTACDPAVDCSEGGNCAADCACSHCGSAVDGEGCSTSEAGCGDNCADGPQEVVCGDNCATAQNGAPCGDACVNGPQEAGCADNCATAQSGAACGDSCECDGCGSARPTQPGTVVNGGCQN